MYGLYSPFDTNPKKEYETLELEKNLLSDVNIQFSYYPITIREVQRNDWMISSVYRGNTNNPNISLNINDYFPSYYQTSELCIYGNPLHPGQHSAELVIKHEPTSSSITPLYVCFLLYKKYSNVANTLVESPDSPFNQLKPIIYSDDSVDIDLSSFLKPYQVFFQEKQKNDLPIKWTIYTSISREDGNGCLVVLIDNPIFIDSSTLDKIPHATMIEAPFVTYDISGLLQSYNSLSLDYSNTVNKNSNPAEDIPYFKEGFVTAGNGGLAFDTAGNNEMVCEVIDDNVNNNQEINFYQMPIGGATNKSQERINTLLAALYLVIGAMLVVATMVFSPMAFDKLLDYLDIKDYAHAFMYGCCLLILIPSVICISIGAVRLDTILITVGVGLGIFAMLFGLGVKTMSNVINGRLSV